MIEVRQTAEFKAWLDKLKDRSAKARIIVRIRRLELGNPGDVKPAGEGVSELRLDAGPGYRIYYSQRGSVAVLLCGGDKGSQSRDIETARRLARELED
jgi:putative addiction module killer protein